MIRSQFKIKISICHTFSRRENRLCSHRWHWKVSRVILTAKIGSQKNFFPLDSLECFFSIAKSTLFAKLPILAKSFCCWGKCRATYGAIFIWMELLQPPFRHQKQHSSWLHEGKRVFITEICRDHCNRQSYKCFASCVKSAFPCIVLHIQLNFSKKGPNFLIFMHPRW